MEKVMIDQLFKDASSSENSITIREFAERHRIDVGSIRNKEGQTLLHVAAGFGKTNLAAYLIKRGANVNAKDNEGQAPIHNACCHGHSRVSKKLIEAGADVNMKDIQGWSPLHFALARRDNAEKISPLYWEVIELLLDSGADPYLKSESGRNCLSRIKNKEDRRNVSLLHLNTMIKNCGQDKQAREDIVDKYLKVEDFFEIIKLCNDGTLEQLITPKLLSSRLKDFDDITPLHRAAGYNLLDIAQLFLREGARVDVIDNHGRIPLHNAAQFGHVEMIELLIANGSDVNKQDHGGFSPLHVAASNPTFAPCLKLIELGADKSLRTLEGALPYDLADSDDVREVLKPEKPRSRLEVVASTSGPAIYMDIQGNSEHSHHQQLHQGTQPDFLMLDSSSNDLLFENTKHSIKIIPLPSSDERYIEVKRRMLNTIMVHNSGNYSSYDILSIDLLLNKKVWSKYRLKCQGLELEPGFKNEKLLFHGSNFIDNIQDHGFDVRYAHRNCMFGAGIYFADHSSKSNQYAFGRDQSCQKHQDRPCCECERKMIYAQVALGRSLICKEAMPNMAHAPPGHDSVTGLPETTADLVYPEYVIYSCDQAYPLYVIRYKPKL